MRADRFILILAIAFVLCAGSFNAFGTFATKFTSSANRCVVEQSRVMFVWMFFLAYQGVGHEIFQAQKLVGFLFIVIGVLFFNKILTLEGFQFAPQRFENSKESASNKMRAFNGSATTHNSPPLPRESDEESKSLIREDERE